MAVNDLITFRKGIASEWISANPVLASGEPGYDLTNSILKIGDGVSNWVALSGVALSDGSVTTAKIADAAVTDAKIASVSATKLTGTLDDARLSANVATRESVGQYFNVPSTAVDVFPRSEIRSSTVGIASGSMFICFFTANKTQTISQITAACGSAGSGLTLVRMGLYTFNETTATLVARTANDTTLFAAASTVYTRSLATAGGYPATYTLQQGTRYGVGVLCVGTTVPNMVGRGDLPQIAALTPRIAGGVGGLSDLPTSTTVIVTINVVWARLS